MTPADPKWATCKTRGEFLRESVRVRITQLRRAAHNARRAYQKPFMNEPCQWLADTYDAAADVLAKRLREVEVSS